MQQITVFKLPSAVVVLSVLLSLFITSNVNAQQISAKIECTSCHDPEVIPKIKAMHNSKHWDEMIKESPVNNEGCVACHGDSQTHAATPTKIKPRTSYGPRWTSSIDEQNNTCLNCHEKTTTHKEWRAGKHANEEVTCVTCHDVHVDVDPVRVADTQAEVCTVCHKVQKNGMHHFTDLIDKNPPCSNCHNPHANPKPQLMMLENRSLGCRNCHDFKEMQLSSEVSLKAKNYHLVMQHKDRTCVDCHLGVAHVDTDNFAKLREGGLSSMLVDVFHPGQSDGDWLLEEHPGAQALRQGRNCRQCHLGDAKELGKVLAPEGVIASVEADVAVKKMASAVQFTITWQGSKNDSSLALMFDNGQVDAFAKGGCWASCHGDLPGMGRDRGLDKTKYLLTSLKQLHSVGFASVEHDKKTLDEMTANGEFVELWRVNLSEGKFASLQRFMVLDERKETDPGQLTASATFANGMWTVIINKAIADEVKPLIEGNDITFGIAIHLDGKSGAEHKVSLPLTMSSDGIDTDFILQ
ncbi:cytochrome c3 family protein [Thalassotalea psychrophila]|uniref:Cytochrome c3 family protein n=1 Tax=Thalassotalea psychrophila TaxID=3065647 RepID=A0ABY9TT23_9GAMM|nr:cytochrome c3 family protein [Colwelliaceae bacterium SQ149]